MRLAFAIDLKCRHSKSYGFLLSQGPLHIPAIPAAKRTGYEDASLLRQPWSYEPPFDYNYAPGYAYSIERDRKVFYPTYPDQYAQVSCLAVLSIVRLQKLNSVDFVTNSTTGTASSSFRSRRSL